MTTEFTRLPTNVVPSHYHLVIRPEISEFTFSGTETVDVQVHERTKTIVLNSLDIAIQSASFVANGQGKFRRFLSCFKFELPNGFKWISSGFQMYSL